MTIKSPSQIKSTATGASTNRITGSSKQGIPTLPAQARATVAQKIFGSHKPEVIPSAPNISSVPKPPKKTVSVDKSVTPADTSAVPSTTNIVVKSRKRTSLEEFAHRKHMRPEIKAGFKVWLHGQNFAFDNEWEQLYINYNNRKI